MTLMNSTIKAATITKFSSFSVVVCFGASHKTNAVPYEVTHTIQALFFGFFGGCNLWVVFSLYSVLILTTISFKNVHCSTTYSPKSSHRTSWWQGHLKS